MCGSRKMVRGASFLAIVFGVVIGSFPATAHAALAGFVWARVTPNQVNYNFNISPVWAYRVQLRDVTAAGPWVVILGPVVTGGAGAAVAANYAALIPGHQYRLRVQSVSNAGAPWVNEGMSGIF